MLKEEILELKANGSTIIFSTHNMASVEELCDDIALINHSTVVLSGPVRSIRKQFRTNTFEISYNRFEEALQPILPEGFTILKEDRDSDHRHATIKIPGEATPNDLLKAIMPSVMIYSVKEVIPNMNDIFIQAVTQKNPEPVTQN